MHYLRSQKVIPEIIFNWSLHKYLWLCNGITAMTAAWKTNIPLALPWFRRLFSLPSSKYISTGKNVEFKTWGQSFSWLLDLSCLVNHDGCFRDYLQTPTAKEHAKQHPGPWIEIWSLLQLVLNTSTTTSTCTLRDMQHATGLHTAYTLIIT